MANQIRELFGSVPDDLEDFVLASQISQAEAKKFFIEMLPHAASGAAPASSGGTCMDGWPQFSDAVVDYYFGQKLAYHYIKRVQTPVCLMVDEPRDWHVRIHAGNDTRHDAEGTYRVWDADNGDTLLAGDYHSPANAYCPARRDPGLARRAAALPHRVDERQYDGREPRSPGLPTLLARTLPGMA